MQLNINFGISSEAKRSFLRDLGLLLHTPAALVLPIIIAILYFEEYYALPSFLGMAAVSLLLGQGLYRAFRESTKSIPRVTIIMVALAWFIIPVIGSIPFYFIGQMNENLVGQATNYGDVPSAFFESMSGFTSTGLTMVTRPDTIPQSLQLWRSVSEWIGGMGLILLAVGFFSFSSRTNMLYQAEAMSWAPDGINIKNTIYRIWYIYVGFTIITFFAFYFLGMPCWEAINHALTGVSTGGFAITESSFVNYTSAIKWATIVVMTIGAISFQIHYLFVYKADIKNIFKLSELRLFIMLFVFFIALVQFLNPSENFVNNVFQTTSALGTCGFNSVKTSEMPVPVLFLFTIAMVLGGNASSTAGGLKTRRAVWILKGMMESIRNSFKKDEESIRPIYVNGQEIEGGKAKEQIRNARNLLVAWILSLIIGSFLILLSEGDKYSLSQIVFDVSSALNSVGLSAGVSGDGMTSFSKAVFIVLMWIGRLEIFACIILLYTFFTTKLFRNSKSKEAHKE